MAAKSAFSKSTFLSNILKNRNISMKTRDACTELLCVPCVTVRE